MDYLWTPWRYAYVTGADRTGRPGVPNALSAWPGDRGCVFCNLIAAADYAIGQGMAPAKAEAAANIVLREQHTFICLNAYPYAPGHLMIVPYAHESDLAPLDGRAAAEMMALAQRSDAVLREVYSPHGINLGMNLGQAAGAGVAGHLHLHILPRWVGDTNFMTVVAETRVLPETLDATWARLREGFARIR